MISLFCPICSCSYKKETRAYNRAIKSGLNLFCSKKCSGIGRRKNKTESQKKEEKRIYDIEYREKNKEELKKKKSEYSKKTYDSKKAKIERAKKKKEKPELEEKRRAYMRSEIYVKNKKKYDRRYKAYKNYGKEWGECIALTLDIRDECKNQMPDYEIRKAKLTLNKNLERKRNYERLNSNKLERCTLGNIK